MSSRRTFAVVAVLAVAMGAVAGVAGCRSWSKYSATSDAGEPANFSPMYEPNADDVSAADAPLYSGTPQGLTVSGSLTGKISDAGRGRRWAAGCTKAAGERFVVNLLGLLDGKDPHRIEFGIYSDYAGPRTYPLSTTIQAGKGVLVFFKNTRDKESTGLVGYLGSVSVNADERSGSLDAQLRGAFGKPERIRIQGTWNCPPARN